MDTQADIQASTGPKAIWIEPAARLEPQTIRCSALDNLCAPVYPSPVEFFPLKAGDDPLVHLENLKAGLARTIYQQPHLAGTLRKDDTGRNLVEISENAGANLIYNDLRGDLTIPSYEQFRENGWPLADGEADGLAKIRQDPFPTCDDGDPLIVPQFTVIRGGMMICTSISHAIGDLVQCKDFVGYWARNTYAVAEARSKGQPDPPLPPQLPAHLMDRSRLRPDVPIEEDLDKLAARAAKLPHMTMLDPRDPEQIGELIQELFTRARLTDRDLANGDEDELRQLSSSVWSFSLASIKKVQAVALQSVPKGTKLSAIDCLTAFTWQRFFQAKWAPSQPGPTPAPESTRIVFAGSVRHRLTPPLPMEYLPACVDLFPVIGHSADLCGETSASLAKVAHLVRTSNDEWSEEAYHEMCSIAQAHPMATGLVPKGPIDALITDHTRSTKDLLQSWGPGLGVCEALREPYFGRTPPPGELTFLPRRDDGMIEVMIAGEAVVLNRLRADPVMNAMAKCQFVMHDFVEKIAKQSNRSRL